MRFVFIVLLCAVFVFVVLLCVVFVFVVLLCVCPPAWQVLVTNNASSFHCAATDLRRKQYCHNHPLENYLGVHMGGSGYLARLQTDILEILVDLNQILLCIFIRLIVPNHIF